MSGMEWHGVGGSQASRNMAANHDGKGREDAVWKVVDMTHAPEAAHALAGYLRARQYSRSRARAHGRTSEHRS